jgi:tRNA(adenine34) deaminase
MVAAALAVAEAGLVVGEQHALESPDDGGAKVATGWRPSADAAWFAAPMMMGGIRREQSRELFRRYCLTAPESGMRRWAQRLVDLPIAPE